jgi:hypothetical protein
VSVPVSFGAGATPKQIYQDLADNGRLDHPYTKAELNNALRDATIQGYGKKTVVAGIKQAAKPQGGLQGTKTSGTLPFTGLDLGLLVAGGLVLLGTGFGIRRLGRSKN